MFGQGASPIVYKTLGIHQPNAFASLVLRETLEFKEAEELLSNADTSGSCSEEENPLFLGRQTRSGRRKFRRVDETGQDDGPGTLPSRRIRRHRDGPGRGTDLEYRR